MTDTSTTTTTTLLTLLHQYTTLHTSASTSLKSSLWQITKARRGRGYQTSGGVGVFGANEYSVENVREELCASALIECQRQKQLSSTTATGLGLKHDNSENKNDSEPELIDEGSDDINNDESITGKLLLNHDEDYLSDTRMVLHFDGLERVNKLATSSSAADVDDTAATMMNDANNNFETTISINNNPNHIQEGLRRRRRNNKGTDDIIENDEANTSSKWTTTEEQQHQSEEGESSSKNDNEQEKHHAAADPIQLFGVPPPALRMAQSYSRDALAYYVEVANLARQIMILVEEKGE